MGKNEKIKQAITKVGIKTGRWVLPTKILETGFRFKYPLLKDALADIIGKVPRKQYHLF